MEDEDFILNNLRQEGVELFNDDWIDMKRDFIKRLIIRFTKQTPDELTSVIGQQYVNWRQKNKNNMTHLKKPMRVNLGSELYKASLM